MEVFEHGNCFVGLRVDLKGCFDLDVGFEILN